MQEDIIQETAETSISRVPTVLFGATIVLSAFLLFQVQPLIAKLILPWFGGSAAVWTSCMLFFQMALLGGYGYAHWLNQQDGKRQTMIHIGLLVVSFLSLPIVPALWWKPVEAGDPLLRILGLLTVTVGLPYFLLSSTSPLLQTWYSRANGGAMPYRLFALSNLGSMAGLLTYPILVEPNLTNRAQAWMWSSAYALFALVCATVAFRSRSGRIQHVIPQESTGAAPLLSEKLLWMGLAAAASALLLAVTNHVTQNIAPIPFLWVAPLSLYLLSFILCFDSDRWYVRKLFTSLAALTLPAMAYAIVNATDFRNLRVAIGFFCVAIFILFMVCHGELARRRPAPAYLTSFYLMVSLGGAIGGLLVGFAAPYLLNAVYDLQVIVTATALLFVYVLWKERGTATIGSVTGSGDKTVLGIWAGVAAVYVGARLIAASSFGQPKFLKSDYDAPFLYGMAGAIAAYLIWTAVKSEKPGIFSASFTRFAIAAGMTCAIGAYLAKDTWRMISGSRVLARNFYGSLQVYDSATDGNQGPVRVLRHGTIDHGEQFLWKQNERRPTTYFTAGSGIGLAVHQVGLQGPMRVGIIGLGAGSIAAYCRAGDNYRYYDINPQVVTVAAEQFTYLSGCPATHDVVLGDARLVLEAEPLQRYDLLVVDAFSGDAIPVHLLTREAWALYWKHLNPNGVLAVHVSNRYMRLGPVVALGADASGKHAKMVSYDGGDIDEEAASDWVLVTSRPGFFEALGNKADEIKPIPGLRAWTDDYSNVYRILR
jgi:SAM-dependent methyltransferase